MTNLAESDKNVANTVASMTEDIKSLFEVCWHYTAEMDDGVEDVKARAIDQIMSAIRDLMSARKTLTGRELPEIESY